MNIFKRVKLYYSHNRPAVHVHFETLTKLDYNYIDEGIYVGTNQCCTAGLSEVLQKEGITSDVSLEGEQLDQPYGVLQYVWIPTVDHDIPTDEQLAFGVATLESLVQAGQKIYLHCKNGHGRSSTFLCAYLLKTRGMTPEQALQFIQLHRPSAHMQPCQKELLQKYYAGIVAADARATA